MFSHIAGAPHCEAVHTGRFFVVPVTSAGLQAFECTQGPGGGFSRKGWPTRTSLGDLDREYRRAFLAAQDVIRAGVKKLLARWEKDEAARERRWRKHFRR